MNLLDTDGTNPDFMSLCSMLDAHLNALAGGEENRSEYMPLNKLDDIHDAFVLYDGALPVGCASFKEYEAGTAEVKRVFVREEYRGRGLSRLLMQAVEEKSEAQRLPQPDPGNGQAARFRRRALYEYGLSCDSQLWALRMHGRIRLHA